MSANNVRSCTRECPKNEYLAEKRKTLCQGHYQPTYRQARNVFIYFITPHYFLYRAKIARKKANVDLMANGAIDVSK